MMTMIQDNHIHEDIAAWVTLEETTCHLYLKHENHDEEKKEDPKKVEQEKVKPVNKVVVNCNAIPAKRKLTLEEYKERMAKKPCAMTEKELKAKLKR